jgi:hypothetical protein
MPISPERGLLAVFLPPAGLGLRNLFLAGKHALRRNKCRLT